MEASAGWLGASAFDQRGLVQGWGALVKGEYYRSESDAKVYRCDGTRLVYQGALPRRAAVILVPDGVLEALGRQYLSH